jgi:hypothetical protein
MHEYTDMMPLLSSLWNSPNASRELEGGLSSRKDLTAMS